MLLPADTQDMQTLFCTNMHYADAASSTQGRFFCIIHPDCPATASVWCSVSVPSMLSDVGH